MSQRRKDDEGGLPYHWRGRLAFQSLSMYCNQTELHCHHNASTMQCTEMRWTEIFAQDDVLHTTVGDTICSGVGWLVGSVHSGPVLSGCPVNPALLPRPPPSVMTSTLPRITSNHKKHRNAVQFQCVKRTRNPTRQPGWNAMQFNPVLVYSTFISQSDMQMSPLGCLFSLTQHLGKSCVWSE